MTLDYGQRTDFRAFDVLIDAIDKATKADLQKALKTCVEQYAQDSVQPLARRSVWRDMATLLRKQIRRF